MKETLTVNKILESITVLQISDKENAGVCKKVVFIISRFLNRTLDLTEIEN